MMNSIDINTAKTLPFFSFLEKTFQSNQFEVFQLAGDASSRRYYRIVFGDESVVLMEWDPFVDNDNYPFLSVLNHFRKNKVRVPKVLAKSPEEGFVLLEDLGDLTLERKFWENQNQELVYPFYKLAIDELIKIHYQCSANEGPCTAFAVTFDTEKLLWEMNYGRKHLIENLSQIQLSTAEDKELKTIFNDICCILDKEPKFIAHRDYHSRNLMITLGKMRVIDFQDARLGPIQYDLVSLLKDSYVELSDSLAERLINYYLAKRTQLSPVPPPVQLAAFQEIYEIQSIQRCFKACGSFASFYNMRKDRRYLKYIKKTLNTVVKSVDKFPQYKRFNEILRNYKCLERDYEQI